MPASSHLTNPRNLSPAHVATRNESCQSIVRPYQWRPTARPRRRFNRGVGFWLGGVLLGAGGCILGGCMPYHHPVGVALSILWWGTYFGCFGASIGALVGLWAEQHPAE
jgi:hypothetical protein